MIKLYTLLAHATTGGGSELENKYGRALCRSKSISCLLPDVYPPAAPPNAFPNVELIMSTLPFTPQYSSVPRPVSPRKPVAWHSSINTKALYLDEKNKDSISGMLKPCLICKNGILRGY